MINFTKRTTFYKRPESTDIRKGLNDRNEIPK